MQTSCLHSPRSDPQLSQLPNLTAIIEEPIGIDSASSEQPEDKVEDAAARGDPSGTVAKEPPPFPHYPCKRQRNVESEGHVVEAKEKDGGSVAANVNGSATDDPLTHGGVSAGEPLPGFRRQDPPAYPHTSIAAAFAGQWVPLSTSSGVTIRRFDLSSSKGIEE